MEYGDISFWVQYFKFSFVVYFSEFQLDNYRFNDQFSLYFCDENMENELVVLNSF